MASAAAVTPITKIDIENGEAWEAERGRQGTTFVSHILVSYGLGWPAPGGKFAARGAPSSPVLPDIPTATGKNHLDIR